jgi:hypothetical protein
MGVSLNSNAEARGYQSASLRQAGCATRLRGIEG